MKTIISAVLFQALLGPVWAFTLLTDHDGFIVQCDEDRVTNNDKLDRRRLAVVDLNRSVHGWLPGKRIAFINFGLDSLPNVIDSEHIVHASLRLFVSEVVMSGRVEIYQVKNSWDERSLKWHHQPALGNKLHDVFIGESDERRWLDLDITQLVKTWILLPEVQHGIAIKAPGSAWILFGSKESNYSDNYMELPNSIPIIIGRATTNNADISEGPSGHAATIELMLDFNEFD